MEITSSFYGGNIERVFSNSEMTLRLRLVPDPALGFKQWFYFRIDEPDRSALRSIEIDVGGALVPAGWPDYQAFKSYDNRTWERAATHFEPDRLVLTHTQSGGTTYFAYFPPYQPDDHGRLLAHCKADKRVAVETLCSVGDSDKLDLFCIGSEHEAALKIWVIGRQHPGEVQASWWIDGFVRRLVDRGDFEATRLLDVARLHIVPNMNPDGSRLGHHRTNRHGRNLNASWDLPSPELTPAVHATLGRMLTTGVDFCLDVHGDEELPYVFVANVDRISPIPDDIADVCDAFQKSLAASDPNFLPKAGRTRPHTLSNPLSFCSPQIMHRFRKPAVTIELPYKKFLAGAVQEREYGVEGCLQSGRAALSALVRTLEPLLGLKNRRG